MLDTSRKVFNINKNPYVISVLNQKGGVGKTTIATNLVHGLILKGYKTLLVDSDPQGSARDWHEANDAGLVPCIALDRQTLDVDLKAIWHPFDVIVIDGAPQLKMLSIKSIKISDLVIIPIQPSPYDIWATEDLVENIKSCSECNGGKPAATFLISRAIKNSNISKDIKEPLESFNLPVMKSKTSQHVLYATSVDRGCSVFSNPITGAATTEFQEVVDEIVSTYL